MSPQRIQRRRVRGWRMPEGAVYVGRPSRWGNPYPVGEVDPQTYEERTREQVVDLFRRSVKFWWGPDYTARVVNELAGKDLVCWCPLDQPCHADVLLEIANAPVPTSLTGETK
jgi:uncharacterized protein DUF4326